MLFVLTESMWWEEIARKGPFPYRSDNPSETHCYTAAAFFLRNNSFSKFLPKIRLHTQMMIILPCLGKFLKLESFKPYIPTFTKESCLKFKKFAMDWRLKLVNFTLPLLKIPPGVYSITRIWSWRCWIVFESGISDSIRLKTLWQYKLRMAFCFDI